MKNIKIVLVMLTAMLILSTSASAAVVYEDAKTYTFDGTGSPDVILPNIATPSNATGYSVYFEFKADIYPSIAGHMWHLHNGDVETQIKLENDGIQVNVSNINIAGAEGSIFYANIPFTDMSPESGWHWIAFSIPTGTVKAGGADDVGHFILDGVDAMVNITGTGNNRFDWTGVDESISTRHMLGKHSTGNYPFKGQIRKLKMYNTYSAQILKVIQTSGSVEVTEGQATDSFTVQLTIAPAADVTITFNPDTKDDIKLATAAPGDSHNLVFIKDNWNVPQTVLVTAYDDATDEQAEDVWIYLSSASGDSKFNEVAISPIIAAVIDNDEYVPAFAESNGSTKVTEQGETSDTYTVVLSNHAPKASVTVDIVDESTPDNVTISPAQLTFTTKNWSVPQTITVKAIDDSLGEMANHETTISHTISSTDSAYNCVVTNLNVNIIDNDIFRMPIIARHLPETNFNPSAGPPYGKALPNISLLAEGTVYLEFKADDHKSGIMWMIDNDQFEISIGVDEAGFVYVNTSNKTLGKNLWYDHEPLPDIAPASGWHSLYVSWPRGPKPVDNWGRFVLDGKDELPAGITNINANNYDFTGITNSSTAGGNHAIGTNPSTADKNFDGQIRNLLVSNVYIPSLLIKVIHSSGSTEVNEQGKTSDSFTIQLRQIPTADVTLTLTPDTNDIKLDSNKLVFTKDNWNAPQTVTVTANDDATTENGESLLISISGASTDKNFHNRSFLPIMVKSKNIK